MHKATFYDHAVQDDGLSIRGMITSGHNQGQMVEIFLDRDTAEMFDWIDPQEEEVETEAASTDNQINKIIHLPKSYPVLLGYLVQYEGALYKIVSWDEDSQTCQRLTGAEAEALRQHIGTILHPEEAGAEAVGAYKAMETALQALAGQILNLRTELLVIKSEVTKQVWAS